ncbi:hypothetical protein GCG54_00003057 [Colletotrichum gloeosporioides]|uniref:Mitochondrial division protein 1 n=1 Tax=Colletotrichum gloeosporioides TaxID=474922 RepID=A0A8H4CVF5_COLGL|nr:uncharacterized protein GCG54_00003057 [Colletotrichum gloeosporioides]KAF3810879.1 hypothetical protein GCG54_00003057 [Colletotrichum gloeosporioides]
MTVYGDLGDETTIPDPDPLIPIEYACAHWAQHLCEGLTPTAQEFDQVHAFLREHYLHWLEAMSLIRSMYESIACILRLKTFDPDGKALALDVGLGDIQVRDAETGGWLNVIETELYCCSSLATSGGHILAAASGGDVFLFNMLTGEEVGEPIETRDVAFAPNGSVLVTGSTEGAVRLWDTQTRECQRTLQANNQRVSVESVAFSSTGLYIAAAVDSVIMVWDVNTSSHLRALISHKETVKLVAFASDNYHLQSASSDSTVKTWDVATSSCLRTTNIPMGRWEKVAFSNNLTKVACTCSFSPIQLWDATTGCLLETLQQDGDIQSLAFSPDDDLLMSATYFDGTISLWDLTNNIESDLKPLSQKDQHICSIAFSSDGSHIAVLSASDLKIWDTNTGQCLQKLDEWKASYSGASVIFGSNGILLAKKSEGNGNVAEIWNVSTATCLQSLADERISTIRGLEFSPDSATLSILTEDIVSLWDVAEGSCRVVYKMPDHRYASNDVKSSETGFHLYNYDWEDGERAIRWEGKTTAAPMGIGVAPLEPLHIPGYSIQNHQTWVKKDGENILRIPPEYRATTYAIRGSMMALGDDAGRVTILRFT